MKDRIKNYFAFNRKEQRGLIILLGLLLLSIALNIFLPDLMPEKEFDITPFQQEVDQFLALAGKLDSARHVQPKIYSNDFNEEEGPVLAAFLASPFSFDPNELSEEQWQQMGMDDRVARNIIRYREKGGNFRDKEGFRKIYGMNDSVFAMLDPYLRFKEKEKASSSSYYNNKDKKDSTKQTNNYTKYKQDTVIIELNSADSASLLALDGIGPSYAGRIIKYRNRLGGFYRPEQLFEIKGMDSIRYGQFHERVSVDQQQVRKIDLNTVTFKELLKHPYFEYYLVKAVFSKKDEIKTFDSVGQLRSISVMYEELYEKISPYLEVR
jgi:competence protein ComEA